MRIGTDASVHFEHWSCRQLQQERHKLCADQCNQSLIDAMVQEKIINPPHRAVKIKGKTLSVTSSLKPITIPVVDQK